MALDDRRIVVTVKREEREVPIAESNLFRILMPPVSVSECSAFD
jgi:hypothetical protein